MTDTTEPQDPMQDVVTILLNRMQEYPEEFVKKEDNDYDPDRGYSRFWKMAEAIRRSMRVRANIARDIKNEEPDAEFNDPLWYLSKAERQALYDGMRNACRHVFTVDVMTTLVAPEEDVSQSKAERLKAANAAANQLYSYPQVVGASGMLAGAVGHPFSGDNAHQEALRRQVQLQAQMQEKQYRNALMAAQQNVYGKLYGG